MTSPQKKTLYVDLDGTLAEWRTDKQEKDTYEEGYFFYLNPYIQVLTAIHGILELYPKMITVKILSAVHTDNPYAIPDKNRWVDKYIPNIRKENRIFVPYGQDKTQYCGGISQDDFLLDDFNKNLQAWQSKGGTPIKLLNGINSDSSTYFAISKDTPADAITTQLLWAMDISLDMILSNLSA